MRVAESPDARGQNLVGRRRCVRTSGSAHRRPVDRVVDCFPQVDVVEGRTLRVEGEVPQLVPCIDVVLPAGRVDAVGRAEVGVGRGRHAGHVVVGRARLDLIQALRGRYADVDLDRVGVRGPRSRVVRVPLQRQPAPLLPPGDVVGPGRRVHRHAVRVDRHVGLDRLEERRRELRREAPVGLVQPDHQLVTVSLHAGHRGRLTRIDGVRADDPSHETVWRATASLSGAHG